MSGYYLAIDIGASSGRHILGSIQDGKLLLEEVYRFENRQLRRNGHDCWDLENLWTGILEGMKACKALGKLPSTIGIDTWAVDFVLLDEAGGVIGDAVSYRDSRTEGMDRLVEELVPPDFLYSRTGIQKQIFNTIYQLMALRVQNLPQLMAADSLLMIPDYFHYRLTGVKKQEYTNATSTGLVNAQSKQWDNFLIDKLHLPQKLFGPLSMPGTTVGELTPEIQDIVGFNATVILPATHDTGSSFLAVPARDENAVYLSSGTWSLMGVENEKAITSEDSRLQNFTNEGGAWYRFRYLKNIMGLWMIQSIRRELNGTSYVAGRVSKHTSGRSWSFPDLIAEAQTAEGFPSVVNANDNSFLSPASMIDAIKTDCRKTGQPVPETTGELMQCVYRSLAQCYRDTMESLSRLTGKTYTSINIVGGGCQDMYLNQMTANIAGLPVYAGPVEGTAIGNLMVQMIAAREFPDLPSARRAVKESFPPVEIQPEKEDSLLLVNTKARIGVFAVALGAYLPQFPSLVPEFQNQYEAFKKMLPDTVELVDGGMVTTKELAQMAGNQFRAADVDLVVVQLLTYATSYNLLPAVRDLDVPVVLVNLQKKKAPDYENTDTATWLGQLYACGAVGEMVADLERAGKRHAVITGVVEGGDPQVQAELEDWCRAAQVRRRFRDTNLAQIGRPYPGMMDLYIDETNLYHRMFLYTKQFDWEMLWAIADDITDEAAIRAKAQDILDTFDIEGGGTIEKVWDMARYVVAFEQWVKDEQIAFVASHYNGFAQGKAGVLDSMLIPAFSMLIKQGVACAVEGDIKVAMAMSILKTISGTGQLSEMYSIDFEKDLCIIGHSGSGDADISERKPTMKIVPVFHSKTGGGYLTQFYPHLGPVTYLGITQDKDGHFKFVAAEGVNEPGPIFTFGDTNMRTRFTCGAREFCNKWSEAGPTHHMAAASGRHIDTILKVAKIFNVPVDIVTR